MVNNEKLVVQIYNALFKSSLAKNSPAVFPNKISNFKISHNEKWVVWGPAKSSFLNIIANKYICDPPLSLKYGKVGVNKNSKVFRVEQVQFKGSVPTAHLSARYEFFKDEFDQTCKKFILDDTIGSNLVPYDVATTYRVVNKKLYDRLLQELELKELEDRWVMGLSNGEMRRARLAYSLLKEPDLLLVDDPFLGLDPDATSIISKFLGEYEKDTPGNGCPIVIGLRYQDKIPDWCTHICCITYKDGILFQGKIENNLTNIQNTKDEQEQKEINNLDSNNKIAIEKLIQDHPLFGKDHEDILKMSPVIELKDISVTYKGEPVLQNINWSVQPGSKWHIRGNNGTGKSTLLSILTAEHPQSWNSGVIENGKPRKVGKTNYFDINKKIGVSSPELHAIILKNMGSKLTLKECIATGYSEGSPTTFLSVLDKLDKAKHSQIVKYIEYFGLQKSLEKKFEELTVSEQKLAMFLRSIIKSPELLILDEAFSGMEAQSIHTCHNLLHHWPGTVLVVSHISQETPACTHALRLLSPGKYYTEHISTS